MNSNAEMISVVIPSYNHSQYIAEAINSVLNERCEDFEIQLIVIDDCSTDNTQEIVEQLLEYFDFEFYRNEYNLGITSTLEKSISFIRGDYICFLGSDDFFLPGRLKKQLDEIKKQGLDAIYAKGKSFDAGSNWIADHNLSDFARALDKSQGDAFRLIAIDDTNGPLFQSSMLRTEVIKDIADLWKEYNSDDWIVLLYLLKEKNVSYLDEFVFGYRLHGSNSHKKYWKMFVYRLDVICNYISKVDMKLQRKAMSNLFISHASAMYRNGEKMFALSFFISAFLFSFPFVKLKKFIKKVFFCV